MSPYSPAWRGEAREIHECNLEDYPGKVEWTRPGEYPRWYRNERRRLDLERTEELIDRTLREVEEQMELFKR